MSVIEGVVVVVAIICFTAIVIAAVVRSVDDGPKPPTRDMHMPTSLWTYDRRPVDKCQYAKVLNNSRAQICTGDAGHKSPHTYEHVDLGKIYEEG